MPVGAATLCQVRAVQWICAVRPKRTSASASPTPWRATMTTGLRPPANWACTAPIWFGWQNDWGCLEKRGIDERRQADLKRAIGAESQSGLVHNVYGTSGHVNAIAEARNLAARSREVKIFLLQFHHLKTNEMLWPVTGRYSDYF